ncbi:MAG: hypothetical protein JWM98_1218, partial [Thermoleophilia bacterium]|nr:hypothetical protein [Thermoleophilia bacterium]
VDPLAQNSPMLLLSTRSILSPSCTRGMVGCFSVREVVYQSGGLGVTTISAGLYGPQAETDATVRVTLRVATTSGGNSPPLVYTAKDNGSSSTRRTPRFIVRLRGASGSTGYAWRPIVDGAATLSPVVHEMITDDCAVGMVGCAETDEFTYLSPRSGPATLRLGLYAPGNPTPVEQFTFSLVEPEVLP